MACLPLVARLPDASQYHPRKDGTHESTDADDSGDVQLDAGRRDTVPTTAGSLYPYPLYLYSSKLRGRRSTTSGFLMFFGQVQKRRASRESSALWPGPWDPSSAEGVGFQ